MQLTFKGSGRQLVEGLSLPGFAFAEALIVATAR
jgi:hypothetical protein